MNRRKNFLVFRADIGILIFVTRVLMKVLSLSYIATSFPSDLEEKEYIPNYVLIWQESIYSFG